MAYIQLDGSAQLAYAEVLDNALARGIQTGEGFSFISARRGRGKYWYLQHSLPNPKKQYYLGVETPQLLAQIEQQKSRWAADKVEAAMLERQVAMATGAGCATISYQAYKVLNAAAQAGLFRAGGVLVGSYAFLAIGNMLGVSWVRDTTLTQDLDFAVSPECMVAIPGEGEPLRETILTADDDFLEVPLLDPKKQSTSFKVRGRDFRVDLITPKTGRGDSPKFVPPVKSYAETVRFLEFVLEDTQKAVMLAKAGVVVNVPNPARFALHKLVVFGRRTGAQRTKSSKDVMQAAQIVAVLLEQRPGDLWLALDAAAEFHDKFLQELKAGINQLDESIRLPLVEQMERSS